MKSYSLYQVKPNGERFVASFSTLSSAIHASKSIRWAALIRQH